MRHLHSSFDMIISSEKFNEIVFKIHSYIGSHKKLEDDLAQEFELPKNTISSIISNENKRKMKKNYHKMINNSQKLFDRYLNLKSYRRDAGIIFKIGNETEMSSALLAKLILEKHFELKNNSGLNESKILSIKPYFKDSTLLEEGDLALEVFLSQLHDNQYGNINDMIRHSLGEEFEYHLRKIVKEKNLSFQSEDDLRIFGYDKTPDIKLNIPFAVDGFIVNWIEGKALFADVEEHKNYTKDQYLSYWNRFGTGLVIYWFGMVDEVMDASEKRFIVRSDFPQEITFIDPFIISKMPDYIVSESEKGNVCVEKKNGIKNFEELH